MPSAPADPAHELPPPSAQRASWTAAAPVRARGSPGSRTVPARHGPWSGSSSRRRSRSKSKHAEPRAGLQRHIATSLATTNPALHSSSSRSTENIGHCDPQSCPVSTSSQTTPLPSSKPSLAHTPSHASLPAAPATRTFFDPWNSTSTGHQRAENTVASSVSWRDSRNLKLGQQFKGGLAGGDKRVADTVGAGSEGFGKDGRKANGGWERGASGLRTGGQQSLVEVWGACKSTAPRPDSSKFVAALPDQPSRFDEDEANVAPFETSAPARDACSDAAPPQKLIFGGLCIYVNGSTAPLVSDHKLKHMLAEHGAKMSIALGRRSVTHVILGAASANGGCGGGLAATKLQKEIASTRGKSIKFVTANWVLDSIKEGRRLPEARFAALKLAHEKQGSVYGIYRAKG